MTRTPQPKARCKCGKRFQPTRRGQVSCSAACRSAAYRARAKKAAPKVAELAASASKDGAIERHARAELEAAGRVDTMLGQAVLALAREIDAGRNSGSVVGGLVDKLRNTMAAATLGANAPGDPVDEFTRRRQERLGGA